MPISMQPRHLPVSGLHYWIALSLASILGCNTGDYWASFFGFLGGLPVLLGALALILFLEPRDRRPHEGYYWAAIIVVRTAATNLADAAARQLGMPGSIAILAILMVVLTLARYRGTALPSSTPVAGLPNVDLVYWGTMLVAGTLGTVLGDFSSFRSGLGLAGASIVWSVIVAMLVAAQIRGRLRAPASYWMIVVAIRTAGTAVGDLSARHVGLWQSTLAFAIVLIGYLVFSHFRMRRSAA
jgi:uncharacterized membrane-anchored protein